MFAVEIELLTGRYVATAHNNRMRAEWPPHPARLFSAAVAACAGGGELSPEQEDTLRWFESLPAPNIKASPASARDVVTVFVPVNDDGVVSGLDDKYADLQAAQQSAAQLRAQLVDETDDGAQKRLLKALQKTEKEVAQLSKSWEQLRIKATERATSLPSATAVEKGIKSLPELRTRQPRTFPSVTPELPVIRFVWPTVSIEPERLNALSAILVRISFLGHSASLVTARVVDAPPEWDFVPDDDGTRFIRVAQKGQLRALQNAFDVHGSVKPRVMPARSQAYLPLNDQAPEVLGDSIFGRNWIVFRRVDGIRLPMTAATEVATLLRRALMKYSDNPVPELLSGHLPDGSPGVNPHMAIVPLPFVDHHHATGLILGVALVFPKDANADQRRLIYSAIARWEAEKGKRDDDDGILPVPLYFGETGEMWLQRQDDLPTQRTLQPSDWCHAARSWSSVTPVALDRNPGNLVSKNSLERDTAYKLACAIMAQSVTRIGLPEPDAIEISFAPTFRNSERASHFGPWPKADGRARKLLVHATLHFGCLVRGPVLLGAGRFAGLGLFRPVNDNE